MIIRPAARADVAAIAAIYRPEVLSGTATFELEPPDDAEMAERLGDLTRRGFPWLVAEESGAVVGYAYAGPYRARAAYRFTVEDSIYLHPTARGRGVGTALLVQLLAEAEACGFRQMIGVIGDSANIASVRLHDALGFRPAGAFVAIGWKHGRWLDTVLMQRPLGPGAAVDAPGIPENAAPRLAPAPDDRYHLVYLERGLLLVKRATADWRDIQAEFADYKTSLGPWTLLEAEEFIRAEHGDPDGNLDRRLAGFAATRATVLGV